MPDFSIIVPIYNVENYLEECLESIAAQTHRDFEVLCVIDGSTDGSMEIARRYSERDSRFRVLEKENGGLSSARNFGVAHAVGMYVVFVDADDRLRIDCCSRLIRAFSDQRADVVVFGSSVFPESENTPWYERVLSPDNVFYEEFSSDFMFAPYTTPFAWRCAVRRRALVASGVVFEEGLAFGEDVVFQFALYPRVKRLEAISDKLYEYRLAREGSLMSQVRDDAWRLRAHAEIVERVFADWREAGLLGRYASELFDWSRDYLLFGVDVLPESERLACFERANELWLRYFGSLDEGLEYREAVHPLTVDVGCVCRGDGKLYAACTVQSLMPFESLEAAARGGVVVPVGVYPREKGQAGCEQRWVLEMPLLDEPCIEVELVPEGRTYERATIAFDYRVAKWKSRLNYRLFAEECAVIRDFEQSFTDGHYQVRVQQRFPNGEATVWRVMAAWRGSQDGLPRFTVKDGRGNPLDATVHVLETQRRSQPDGAYDNVVNASVGLPACCNHFIVLAESPDDEVELGFAVIDAASAVSAEADTAALMKHAGVDDGAYFAWFKAQRASAGELEAQRAQMWDAPVEFACIVIGYGADSDSLKRTLGSVHEQTYGHWRAWIVGATLPDDVRDSRFVGADARIGAVALKEALAQCEVDYLLLLKAGDELEPVALHAYASALQDEEADVLYCDEDVALEDGTFGQPLFKSQLNRDLLYCGNWLGAALVMRAPVLSATLAYRRDADVLSYAGLCYDCALHAIEEGACFRYVPNMLCHTREASFPGGQLDFLASCLVGHFDRRGVRADVRVRDDGAGLRTVYVLPDPKPLVSIVIPSKDQADLLEACVRSLVEKATYDAYEIVVVENNSVDADTLERYARLEAELPAVRIERWPDEFNYSKIVNFGAEQARGDYLLFLNNDTQVISPDFIQEMLGFLQRDEVGVVGAKLLFEDGLVQHSGMAVGVYNAVVHVNQNRPASGGGYLNRACLPGNYSSVTGACQMTRRSTFNQVGGYDERFAVGFNDVDFCLRVQQAGLLVTFAPEAVLYHKEFASRGREVEGAKLVRWRRERALLARTWPKLFVDGDPYTSPNLKRDNTYYALGEPAVTGDEGRRGFSVHLREVTSLPGRVMGRIRRAVGRGRDHDASGNGPGYGEWFARHRATSADLDVQRAARFALQPKFSVIVPLYATPLEYLADMASSVLGQTYSNLELVLVNASPNDKELCVACARLARADDRVIVRELPCNLGITLNTNEGILAATGDFLCFVDHDDVIEPDALFEYAKAVNECPTVDLLYCDEDKLLGEDYVGGFFKPDFDRTLIRSVNFVTHMLAVRAEVVAGLDELPGPEFDGAQDHNLTLVAAERARAICHVPKVLYHWRIHEGSTADDPGAKSWAADSGKLAVEQHLHRLGETARVNYGTGFAYTYEISYPTDEHFTIVVVPDQVSCENRMRMVNEAVQAAEAALVAIMGNDVKTEDGHCLEMLASHACRPGVVACGPKVLYEDDVVRSLGIVISGGVPVRFDEGAPRYQRSMHVLTRFAREMGALDPDCFVIRRDVFLQVGGLDESLPFELAALKLFFEAATMGALVVEPLAEVRVSSSQADGGKGLTDDEEALVALARSYPERFSAADPHYSRWFAPCSANFELLE